MSIQSIQQQLGRNRGKSTVLGVLTVVLAIMGIRAVQSFLPQKAEGMPTARTGTLPQEEPAAPTAPTDLEKKARTSQALWSVLRDKRGLEAPAAFHFDSSYYNLDPAKAREREALAAEHSSPIVTTKSWGDSTDQQVQTAREVRVREQARVLVLQTTILGEDPRAIISVAGSTRYVRAGEMINGFKILAIVGREVTIQKDGVTLGLGMGSEGRP